MALIKLWETEKSKNNDASRASKASKVSKIPSGAFRRILEYYEPVYKLRITEHYKYNPEYPINYTWP